jgi:hypothetical protein
LLCDKVHLSLLNNYNICQVIIFFVNDYFIICHWQNDTFYLQSDYFI